MNPKAIFFDVDSTLYSHRDHDFPQTCKQALIALKKRFRVGIATSRCIYEMQNLPSFYHAFPFDGYIYNGGSLAIADEKVYYQQPIATQQVNQLVAYSRKNNIAMRYATFHHNYFDQKCDWRIKEEFFRLYLNMPTTKPYAQEEVYNILLYPQENKQITEVRQIANDCSLVLHESNALEITAKGIDKSIGIQALLENWKIKMSDVICFGDGANDVLMLKAAGIGVAMGNGHPDALASGDLIAPFIDEQGIYEACKTLRLL